MERADRLEHPNLLDSYSTSQKEEYNSAVVKPFYIKEEDYDWTAVTDAWHGPETIMHRLREREGVRAIRRFAVPGRMLDVGCGSGLMLRHLPAGSFGIDINPRNVIRARHYAPQAVIAEGDAEQLRFPDGHFTTVVCTEVLEHLVFPERAISEIYRVLAPGGVFIGTIPCDSWLWNLRSISATCPVEEPFHNEMSRSEIADLFSPFERFNIRRSFWLMHYIIVAFKSAEAR